MFVNIAPGAAKGRAGRIRVPGLARLRLSQQAHRQLRVEVCPKLHPGRTRRTADVRARFDRPRPGVFCQFYI